MIYEKGSVDYDVNLCSLHEMEEVVPMTLLERSRLRSWAKDGHDVDSNPWKIFEPDGSNMNYLKAHRRNVCYPAQAQIKSPLVFIEVHIQGGCVYFCKPENWTIPPCSLCFFSTMTIIFLWMNVL